MICIVTSEYMYSYNTHSVVYTHTNVYTNINTETCMKHTHKHLHYY